MVSRDISRLRAALSVVALLIFLPALLPATANSANIYDYTDRHEGDPGDGVLDPAVEGGGSGIIKNPDLIVTTSGGESLPTLDFILVPVYISTGMPGQGTFIFVPRFWSSSSSRYAFGTKMREGGWPYAP
jgi:hypothetical protein